MDLSNDKLSSIRKCILVTLLVVCSFQLSRSKRVFKCPSGCTCTTDSIICVGSSLIPRTIPSDINSLSIVNCSFTEIKESMFSLMPSLQLLLLSSNSFSEIKEDAFSGLPHIEYLFIEGNKIEEINKYAFRGLRGVTHLSLANNNLKTLPRGLFSDLRSLIELDLRGNMFHCDCESMWLMLWLKRSNATISDVYCASPSGMKGVLLKDVPEKHSKCVSTDFVEHQIVNTQSMSADIFFHKDDIYVAMAVPNSDSCIIMEWDHIETKFRPFDNITGRSVVGCRSVLINEQAFVIVSQLFDGSLVYKYDQAQNKFTKFQAVEMLNVSKPNDIEVFQIGDDWFFLIVDSSKAGMTTLFKWNETGFYPYQFLHEWFRDTDAEFFDLDGKSVLILVSRSQVPVIYQWNKSTQKFVLHDEIANMDDIVSVKAFRINDVPYLALACYIGDSKVMKWTGKHFEEVQGLPSRGATVLQPIKFKEQHYLILSSDYSFSQIFKWDEENQKFIKFRDVYVQWPRSFTALSTDQRDFVLATSFKGKTKVFEHISVDYSK
ncbi:leucine-rich repeat LGI family member 2-like isoform X1 [Carassius carassius]|uniref:leucine-rich repeat LGI family member 2-like isoform X1 n=2 Tax=Carassius carassius TaxID=217509 RepID=UPI002868B880|nr:leucine-rich repeat LGI family member 2-like isoform X1 [Carassius carassius]